MTSPLVDEILQPFRHHPGLHGYKNHVSRVIDFCDALSPLDEIARTKVTIAACFHDLGLFTEGTLDYLPPSISLARGYLTDNGLEQWRDEIETMIDQHHRLRPIDGAESELIELFRKADLIDFSLGIFRFGVSRSTVSRAKAEYPNNGFHRHLVRTAGRWICRHPLNPLPIVKW